jgi:hypothetical protein
MAKVKKKKAQKPKIDKSKSTLITSEFRLSYPHLFEPQAMEGSTKKKFSIVMLFPKDKEMMGQDPATKKPRSIKRAIKNAKLQAFGAEENWPDELVSPIADGDDPKYKDKDGYKGHWVIKASSNEDQRPVVVDRKMNAIVDASEIYPGCYARACIFAYVWEFAGKQGVSFILDHVQKLRDGKSFGGKKPVDQVFAPLEDEDDEEDFDNGADEDSDEE